MNNTFYISNTREDLPEWVTSYIKNDFDFNDLVYWGNAQYFDIKHEISRNMWSYKLGTSVIHSS